MAWRAFAGPVPRLWCSVLPQTVSKLSLPQAVCFCTCVCSSSAVGVLGVHGEGTDARGRDRWRKSRGGAGRGGSLCTRTSGHVEPSLFLTHRPYGCNHSQAKRLPMEAVSVAPAFHGPCGPLFLPPSSCAFLCSGGPPNLALGLFPVCPVVPFHSHGDVALILEGGPFSLRALQRAPSPPCLSWCPGEVSWSFMVKTKPLGRRLPCGSGPGALSLLEVTQPGVARTAGLPQCCVRRA